MKFFWFTILLLQLLHINVYSQNSERSPCWSDCTYIAPKVYYQFINVSSHSITHNQFLGLPDDDDLDGVLFGFDAGYIYKSPCGLYVQLDFSYAGGKLHANNSRGRFAHYVEYEGLLGCYYAAPSLDLIPFIGVAYDYHRQNFKERTHTGRKLNLTYHIFSIPVGIKLNFYSQPTLELGLLLKVMPQINSRLTSREFSSRRLKLKNTVGYHVEVPLTWNTYCHNYVWKFIITPFWKQFSYGKAESTRNSILTLTCPKETINDFGASITAGTLF